jgi:DNA-directed RNA polymerase specialized sigma24 family protein
VSTPSAHRRPHPGADVRPQEAGAQARSPVARPLARGLADPAEQVALVARAKREVLLRAYRHRLRGEDLEDCYSQATLELLASVRAGRRFSGCTHLANALEQRFVSRVRDRRRALSGRSPLQAALEGALPLGVPGSREVEVQDLRADVHPLVTRRLELERVPALALALTPDQRLVVACQVALEMDRAEFCGRFGWSFEKYRKVAQRARARLRVLLDAEGRAPATDAARGRGTGRRGTGQGGIGREGVGSGLHECGCQAPCPTTRVGSE